MRIVMNENLHEARAASVLPDDQALTFLREYDDGNQRTQR
jgi:hypothetical protein